jgi:hypothetical protein
MRDKKTVLGIAFQTFPYEGYIILGLDSNQVQLRLNNKELSEDYRPIRLFDFNSGETTITTYPDRESVSQDSSYFFSYEAYVKKLGIYSVYFLNADNLMISLPIENANLDTILSKLSKIKVKVLIPVFKVKEGKEWKAKNRAEAYKPLSFSTKDVHQLDCNFKLKDGVGFGVLPQVPFKLETKDSIEIRTNGTVIGYIKETAIAIVKRDDKIYMDIVLIKPTIRYHVRKILRFFKELRILSESGEPGNKLLLDDIVNIKERESVSGLNKETVSRENNQSLVKINILDKSFYVYFDDKESKPLCTKAHTEPSFCDCFK